MSIKSETYNGVEEIQLMELQQPMPCKWRPQQLKNGKAVCVAYHDSRQVQERLDSVCGISNWQSRHKEVKGNLFCEIGIFINGQWIWKSDVGSESSIEKEKGESSDSFKRAAVMWGVGRDLYKKKMVVLKTQKHTNGKEYPVMEKGKKAGELIFNNELLTQYINWLENGQG